MQNDSLGGRLAASLALIAVLGPSAVDMYLASMPDMAHDLNTSYVRIQLTLTVFLLAMGLGQLLFGPVIDAFGRRRPLLAGVIAFVATASWAATAGSVDTLLYARFFQGLAAALTLVVVLSMVRDVSEGAAAARLFALLMTIEGLAPIFAPAAGGYIDTYFGWRGVLWMLAVMGVFVFLNTFVNVSETLPVNKRTKLRARTILRTYVRIALDGYFLLPALALSAVFFFLFAYIGGAALIYQETYGLTSKAFGLVFGATGFAVMLGAMASGKWVGSVGVSSLAIRGALTMGIGAVLAYGSAVIDAGLPGIVAGLFLSMFGLGIAESTLLSMAMASQQRDLGSTAALLGGLQLTISSAATPLAASSAQQGPMQWTVTLTVIGAALLFLTVLSARRQQHDVRTLAEH